MLRFNIITIKHCSIWISVQGLLSSPSVLLWREEPPPTNKFISCYFKIKCFFWRWQYYLFSSICYLLQIFTYIFPEPFHTTTQTSQLKVTLVSFSHGIALFSSSIFSINGSSGPLDTFLFVVFLFFFSLVQAIFFL